MAKKSLKIKANRPKNTKYANIVVAQDAEDLML